MKKITSILTLVIALLCGILVGLRLFVPWEEISELAFVRISSVLRDSGITMNADGFSTEGAIPSILFDGVSVDGLGLNMHLGELSVSFKPFSSLLERKPVFDILVEDGVLTMPGDSPRRFHGKMSCNYGGTEISFSNVDIAGDFSISGNSAISVSNKKILEADMVLAVPDTMEGAFPMAKKFLPLSKGKDGKWLLSRKRGS